MSVSTLLGTPTAAGLFRGAIAQSGAASHAHDTSTAEWVTDRFLAALGLSPSTADALLALPAEEILRAQATVDAAVLGGAGPGIGRLAFQPVVDGTRLPRPPFDAIRDGSAAGVNLVVGTTAEEWNLFQLQARSNGNVTDERLLRRLARVVGEDRVDDTLAVYRDARPGTDLDGLFCAVMTDSVFRMPAIRVAEAQAAHAPRVSMYRFDYRSTAFGGVLGACHAIDVPFTFANLDRRGVELMLGGIDDATQRLADTHVAGLVQRRPHRLARARRAAVARVRRRAARHLPARPRRHGGRRSGGRGQAAVGRVDARAIPYILRARE